MNKKGVSAEVTTVIVVAITIAITIAVAYWMDGLRHVLTPFKDKNNYVIIFIPETSKGAFNITITEYLDNYQNNIKKYYVTDTKTFDSTAENLTFSIKPITNSTFNLILIVNGITEVNQNNINAVWWSDYYP